MSAPRTTNRAPTGVNGHMGGGRRGKERSGGDRKERRLVFKLLRRFGHLVKSSRPAVPLFEPDPPGLKGCRQFLQGHPRPLDKLLSATTRM